MSPEVQKILDLLHTQLGYSEQGGGYTKFGDWYGNTVEFDSDYSAQPWCDMFLSWAAHKLGYEKWFGQFAYTVDHAKWFIDHDAWGTTPKPGAVVFFDWGGSHVVDNIDHVGMVTSVDGDTIHTIEGNVDGQFVREKVRDQSSVVGYGYPDKVQAEMADPVADKVSLTGEALRVKLTAAESQVAAPSHQADLGTASLVAPMLIAALVLIAYFKVTRASVRLALAVTRRGPGSQSTTARSPMPYRPANSASLATASRPRFQGRTIMRSTPSDSQPPTSSGPASE